MRTTLEIDDTVLAVAREIATAEHRSVGAVLSELARRGLRPAPVGDEDGFPVFDVPIGAEPITPEMVRQAWDE